MVRYGIFAVLMALIGLACFELGRRGASSYERMLVTRVMSGLDVLELTWAEVRADGLRLELRGHAPDLFARDLALESARATAPSADVIDFSTVTLAPPQSRDPIRVEIYRDSRGVTMTGQLSSRTMREHLNLAIERDGPEITVHDLTGIQAKSPPRSWGPEIEVASLAASHLPNAYVVMRPGEVVIEGQVDTEDERQNLTDALLQRALDRVALILRIRIPADVIAPFAFSAYKDPGGGIRLERCAARNVTEQAKILGMLRSAGAESHAQTCPIGLGGPRGDWPGAIAAGLGAVRDLPAGRFDVEYNHVQLRGFPPTSRKQFEDTQAAFLADLPADYQGGATLMSDDVATRTAIAREQYWMRLERQGDVLTMTGQVHDVAAEVAIETYALAMFGAGRMQSALRVADQPPPRGWQGAAMHAIEILKSTRQGDVRLAGYRMSVDLTVTDPAEARLLHANSLEALAGYELETRIKVAARDVFDAIPMPTPRCVSSLNEINMRAPLDFDAGSAVLAKSSTDVLDELASFFRRCAGAEVEIGGHTDARGSEGLNARLSQARAEAVLEALAIRGVPQSSLIAKGYGESKPVADNATEDGRARNRRIEFSARAVPEATAPAPQPDAETAPQQSEN